MDQAELDNTSNSDPNESSGIPPFDVATVIITSMGLMGVGYLTLNFVRTKIKNRRRKKSEDQK